MMQGLAKPVSTARLTIASAIEFRGQRILENRDAQLVVMPAILHPLLLSNIVERAIVAARNTTLPMRPQARSC